MSKSSLRHLVLLTAVLLGFGYFFGCFKLSDRKEMVKQLFREIKEKANYSAPLHPFEILTRANRLKSYVEYPFHVSFPEVDYQDRTIELPAEAKTKIAAALKMLESLETDFRIEKIELKKSKAIVVGVVSVLGTISGEGQFFDQHRIQVELHEYDDVLKIVSVRHLKNMRE